VHLAQVFERESLDFLLFLSSFNSFARPAGQSNYAAGCTFEDAFAAQLGRVWDCRVKVINWGYWGSVGVVASQEYRERMARIGMEAIEPAEAMESLEHLLADPVDQMVFLKTTGSVPSGEMIQANEMVRACGPECLPSFIHNLQHTNLDARREPLDAKKLQAMQEMEELLYKLLWSHLQSLGLFREKHAVLTHLREQAGITIGYDRWLQESITLLERQHYLHCDGRAICAVVDPTLTESTTLWQYWDLHKERWIQSVNLKAQVVLVETMLRTLPPILTGKRSATEMMFPNGSMELVEGIYQQNLTADYFNEILAQFLVTYLQDRLTHDEHARIRILEIGAGTGGTTSKVLQMLQPYQASIAEYCYSDISEAFLHYGQWKYAADHPYLTYQRFNVENPLAEQGIGTPFVTPKLH